MTLGDQTPPPAVPADVPSEDVEPASLMTQPAVPPKAKPRKPMREMREASLETRPPREKAIEKAIDPDQLIGLSPPAVQKIMGAPTRVRDDHLSREWVYSGSGCNFRVFFYPDLNAASFHALKYGGSDSNGGTLASSNACVHRILTARANAAD